MINSPLQSKEFRWFISARFFFIMALRMVAVAMVWHVSILTKNTLAVGILGLSEVIPAIGFALYAGHVVDISDKRKLLLKCIAFYGICLILLIAATSSVAEINLKKQIIVWSIYACIFLTGIIRSFAGPAFSAFIAQIISREYLAKAITISTASWQTASVVGSLLTGFLIAFLGITYTLIVILFFVLFAVLSMLFIKSRQVQRIAGEKKTLESVKEGIRFVMNTKAILGALSLDLFAVFFGGATAMLSFYVTDILKVGPIWFGWLNAATSMGAIGVLLAISIKPITAKQGKILLYAVAGFGICIITFALSKNVWLSLTALLVSGIFDGLSVVIRSTILQLYVPDEMRGRVSSVSSIFINSSNELGQFESGVAAKMMGTVPSVVFGGCMTLLVVAITWFKAPTLRKMEY
ncbi:MAG: MFS transporter [Chitinophagaceae bacterium]|nr:MFS transporter [Chitinophagaceae bacterium]